MSKKMRKEKEQGYSICANNDPSEMIFEIFRDALSHKGEATVYWVAAEAQSRFKKDFGRKLDALVTGNRSKFVSDMHHFCPLHSIYFL